MLCLFLKYKDSCFSLTRYISAIPPGMTAQRYPKRKVRNCVCVYVRGEVEGKRKAERKKEIRKNIISIYIFNYKIEEK